MTTKQNFSIQACIFDLDGVIVDTAHYHFLAWQQLANELGFNFDEKQNEQLKGVGRMESLDIILGWGNLTKTPEEKQSLATKKNNWYQEYIQRMKKEEILPGVLDFLDDLQEREIKMAVASSSKNAPTVLDVLEISDYFDAIVDGSQITRSKPDPQVFQLAAEKLGVQPEHSIVFEDAQAGIEAALDGGFFAVGIGTPEHLGEADFVMEGFENVDFEQLVKNLITEN